MSILKMASGLLESLSYKVSYTLKAKKFEKLTGCLGDQSRVGKTFMATKPLFLRSTGVKMDARSIICLGSVFITWYLKE